MHESHPIYSGGLGLLAGDHMKSASDLGLPFVGVGLLYRNGYFSQVINREGKQEAYYPYHNFNDRPIKPVLDADGNEIIVKVEFPGRDVFVKVWKAKVGRVNLFMLDANIPFNKFEDRCITGQLYGGDRDTRISQEILLGIGGVRALRCMGINPSAWHINEGHAAFLVIERLREFVAGKGLPFSIAVELVKGSTLFTTHTPVAAGHDLFPAEMVCRYFGHMFEALGIDEDTFLDLGWDTKKNMFNMTLLAIRHSGYCNGVSKIHGKVSRALFSDLYPKIPLEEIPITHVTNGIHTSTWLAREIKDLYNIYLGTDWQDRITDRNLWQNHFNLSDNLLWVAHQSLKEKMIIYARKILTRQRIRNQESRQSIREVENYLNPDVLTIGFARRFAGYKRAGLLFRDKERLNKLVNNPEQPVQFIFAGKAHPADKEGQELIKLIFEISKEEAFKGKIIFLEGYGIDMARYLLQGVDVWLNTPRYPMEASGTSGQKAAINGVINLSVLDGWWPEAYNGRNGYAIGKGLYPSNEEIQDRDDYFSLVSLLEERLIPAYYNREYGFPRKWVQMMKNSIQTITPVFSTDSMVKDYCIRFYVPLIMKNDQLEKNDFNLAHELSEYKSNLIKNWCQIRIKNVESSAKKDIYLGEAIRLRAEIQLGTVLPGDVIVEAAYGCVSEDGLCNIKTIPMSLEETVAEGSYIYSCQVVLPQGTYGYTIRVRPGHPGLIQKFDPPLVVWADSL